MIFPRCCEDRSFVTFSLRSFFEKRVFRHHFWFCRAMVAVAALSMCLGVHYCTKASECSCNFAAVMAAWRACVWRRCVLYRAVVRYCTKPARPPLQRPGALECTDSGQFRVGRLGFLISSSALPGKFGADGRTRPVEWKDTRAAERG